jgi:UDP-N-acetyl-D-galactosamine dehydrogenase
VIRELQTFGTDVHIYDPHAETEEVQHEYGLSLVDLSQNKYHAVVLAVSHNEFSTLDIRQLTEPNGIVYDVKGFLKKSDVSGRL